MIKFNWVDLFALILLIRICYISYKNGIYAEIFKFLAVLVTVITGLHFLKQLGNFLEVHLFFPDWFAQGIAVLFVFFVSFLIFFLLRVFFSKFMSTKFAPQVDKIGALVLGVGRGFFTVSLILVVFQLMPNNYMRKSLWENSFSGPVLVKIAPATYGYLIKFVPNSQTTEIIS